LDDRGANAHRKGDSKMMSRRMMIGLFAVAALTAGCGGATGTAGEGTMPATDGDNPLLAEFDTPFGVPPFDAIGDEHYVPAFETAMAEHQAEVDAIANSADEPTFDNTVGALDYAGQLLTRVANVFFPKNGADTNDRIQEIAKEIAPKLSAHGDGIKMNGELFARIKKVYDGRADLGLSPEQLRLLEETYKDFVRGGAELDSEDKERLTEINQRLSVLSLEFSEHLLDENNEFKLVIEKEEDLAGLPASSVSAAPSTNN